MARATPASTPSSKPLQSVSRPKQARSARTLENILSAAEALIAEKGLPDASIPEIVRRAGSSVGGFYARFKDKAELLRALEERFFGEMLERVDALADPTRWEGVALPTVVQALADELITIFAERRNLIGAFLHSAGQDRDELVGVLRFRERVTERVAALLMTRRQELTHPDPELGIHLAVQFALALMLQFVQIGEVRAAGRTLDGKALQTELERNFLAYLGAPLPAPAR